MIGESLGSYRIVSAIGQGGMGVVYRAEHTLLGKQVAIKVLLREMSTDASLVERFFNELLWSARALKQAREKP